MRKSLDQYFDDIFTRAEQEGLPGWEGSRTMWRIEMWGADVAPLPDGVPEDLL